MGKIHPKVHVDDTDLALLRLLQDDASLSTAALAEKLSLSVTPCWRRRRRLEAEGLIKGYQARLERRLLGYDVLAYVHVRFGDHVDDAPDLFEEVVRSRPEVLSCHKVSGDADYVLVVLAQDLDNYADFVERVLRKQRGIASIQSNLALREVKATSKIPVPLLAGRG